MQLVKVYTMSLDHTPAGADVYWTSGINVMNPQGTMSNRHWMK